MREGWEVTEVASAAPRVAVLARTSTFSLPGSGGIAETAQPQPTSLERRLSALRRHRRVKRLWGAWTTLGRSLGFLALAGVAGLGFAGVR